MTEVGPVTLGPIAHGGHCVARVDGRVVFVRHGIPGELVRVRITDDSKARFWWGEVSEVITASADRVTPRCSLAGQCGGCDFQHVSLARQRHLKAEVISEQLRRLAGSEVEVNVEQVPGDHDGLGWRTRMRYLTRQGRIGLRAWRSDALVDLSDTGCPMAHPDAQPPRSTALAKGEVLVAVGDDARSVLCGEQLVEGPSELVQRVHDRSYRVRADGFWQVHPGAATILADTVVDMLRPRTGESALDLYCGVGLFAGRLVDEGCRVSGVELSREAVRLARHNVPQARFRAGRMERLLASLPARSDIIVLDPPRSGAGASVVRHLSGLSARAIAYVACDPAALARDVATFRDNGWQLEAVRAFDLFPMTHHVESVALLLPQG